MSEEMRAIAEQVERLMRSADYREAMLWQYRGYGDRLGFTIDAGAVVMVSFLRPADGCLDRFHECVCALVDHHVDTIHRCACGGSWNPDHSVVRYPGLFGDVDVSDADRRPPFATSRGGIRFIKPPSLTSPA